MNKALKEIWNTLPEGIRDTFMKYICEDKDIEKALTLK
jgi:hypothetical protein